MSVFESYYLIKV